MENIDFVMWVVLYHIGYSIASHINAKTRKIEGREKKYDKWVYVISSLIHVIIWYQVGKSLF